MVSRGVAPDGRGGPGRAGGPPQPLDFDAPPVCGQRGGGFGRMRAGGTTMEQFATMISGTAQRVVIDKTGLTGYYDIAADLHADRRSAAARSAAAWSSRAAADRSGRTVVLHGDPGAVGIEAG